MKRDSVSRSSVRSRSPKPKKRAAPALRDASAPAKASSTPKETKTSAKFGSIEPIDEKSEEERLLAIQAKREAAEKIQKRQ